MDPNETLNKIRFHMKQANETTSEAMQDAHYRAVAYSIEALDEWLSKGGFLPDDWRSESYKALVQRRNAIR